MSKVDNTILITFPIFITKYTKGQIGIHLRGLLKPDIRLSVRFSPGPNILATKLDWTLNGAILYFPVMKDKPITVRPRIGTIHWQPFQQPGKCNLPAILSFIPKLYSSYPGSISKRFYLYHISQY